MITLVHLIIISIYLLLSGFIIVDYLEEKEQKHTKRKKFFNLYFSIMLEIICTLMMITLIIGVN